VPFRTPEEIATGAALAARHLAGDGVIVVPTETVYGFGCSLQTAALARLVRLKRRDQNKPFLLLVPGLPVQGVEWTDSARRLAETFWPGPLTLVLRSAEAAFPAEVRSAEGKVAIRCSPHEGVRRILEQWGSAITSTSANVPGEPAAQDADSAAAAAVRLGGESDVLVLDSGRLPASEPSTLVDASREPPRILRVGALGTETLRRVLGVIDVA
jgi:L-threonylcarbamoyladenylate synthase